MSFILSDRSTRVAGSRAGSEVVSGLAVDVLDAVAGDCASAELESSNAEMSLAYDAAVPIVLMGQPPDGDHHRSRGVSGDKVNIRLRWTQVVPMRNATRFYLPPRPANSLTTRS